MRVNQTYSFTIETIQDFHKIVPVKQRSKIVEYYINQFLKLKKSEKASLLSQIGVKELQSAKKGVT